MEHGPLLLKRVIIALAAAEPIPEVMVVLVVGIWLLRVHATLGARLLIDAQVAGARGWEARGTAVAGEVALGKNFDESVLAVALDGAGVADAGRVVGRFRVGGWWVAGQTGEDGLAEGTERLGAGFDALVGG